MSLWLAMKEKKYNNVMEIIKSNPDLVNSKNDDSYSLLMITLEQKPASSEQKEMLLQLIEFIVTHEKFNPNDTNPNNESNIDFIIDKARLDIIEMAPEKLLFNGQNLTFQCAQKKFEEAQRVFERESKRASAPILSTKKARMDSFDKMTKTLRDATIRCAIASDDVTIFEKLEQAGTALANDLLDGTSPQDLLTVKNPKLKKWFATNFAKSVESLAGSHQPDSPNQLKEMKQIQEQMNKLRTNFLCKDIEVLKTAAQSRQRTLENISNVTSAHN